MTLDTHYAEDVSNCLARKGMFPDVVINCYFFRCQVCPRYLSGGFFPNSSYNPL